MQATQSTIRNSFLRAVQAHDFLLVAAHLKRVDLPRRMVLVEENRPIPYVYFPEQGLASIVALQPDREMIEVGTFGFDGSSDFVINPGQDRVPLRTLMQVAGSGWRIEAARFADAIYSSPTFMGIIMRYEQYKATQFAYTALSHGGYTVPERLARWVLMAQDRLGDTFSITHEYLAMMLAVRRAGVTEGIQKLEREGFLNATRGQITIADRDRLRAFANGSYGFPEAEYERLIGPLTREALQSS